MRIMTTDINLYVEMFMRTLYDTYCDCFPLKTKYVSNKQLNMNWMTPHIKQFFKAKSDYFQLYRLNSVTYDEKRSFKNKVAS